MAPTAIDTVLIEILRILRGSLSACAEMSNKEEVTARVIANFISAYAPDSLLTNIGGNGVAAVFNGLSDGPTVLIRAELDALPVEDLQSELHGSASHRCGHDGHMAMVAGLAPLLMRERTKTGRVILLFQPAEETGEGAMQVLRASQFPAILPDYVLALHNLPGFALNQIVFRPNAFASASGGLRIHFQGIASHAAEPETARSPTAALSSLLTQLPELTDLDSVPYRMLTITHVQMGMESFGITPGEATIFVTLRSATMKGLEGLCEQVERQVREVARRDRLDVAFSRAAWFPETNNDVSLTRILEECCRRLGISTEEAEKPFRWSEDFGHFASVCPILYFGLGIGKDAVGLHQPDYRFPDEVIQTGLAVFDELMRTLTSHQNALKAPIDGTSTTTNIPGATSRQDP